MVYLTCQRCNGLNRATPQGRAGGQRGKRGGCTPDAPCPGTRVSGTPRHCRRRDAPLPVSRLSLPSCFFGEPCVVSSNLCIVLHTNTRTFHECAAWPGPVRRRPVPGPERGTEARIPPPQRPSPAPPPPLGHSLPCLFVYFVQ